ncbi:hypothetical protein ATY41_05005 [Leifsonia xyli subsp. xyli]|uniref:Uncharacterized protein n=1 Tax=Leifsonia xyli subsp. xyli TaxID=59736 RepID=A0A1E2SID6_LEIXY|nr:hypothetical protein [Leifsonia xyli]ODA89626.1 hypothetical protein ATY41_05005 [Leifsonia xyli subsp. xyli]
MREIILAVDWGQTWPLSDIMWDEADQPDWASLLSTELIERLRAWARYFNEHADLDSASFGGEAARKWFDLEGVALLNLLQETLGDRYQFRLELWF